MVAEKTGHIDSSGGHAQRPLAMSRHRFLMLGASIVGVGMLPFAQRKYAYAASNVSTDDYSTPATRKDPTKHTQILQEMFTDPDLSPPYHFRLMPNRKDNGAPLGWWVRMVSPWNPFPVKSSWTLTGGAAGATSVDPAAGLYRYGLVHNGRIMFRNQDTENGNSDIRFERVYVDGRKRAAATVSGTNFGERDLTPAPRATKDPVNTFNINKHYYDIDVLQTFVRIGHNPNVEPIGWNYRVHFVECEVNNWPGISCEFRQVNDFDVSRNKITSSHRGSLIFRLGARHGSVNNNTVENGGDDCIAFNGSVGFFADALNTGGALGVTLSGNTLGEKEGQDIREPAGARHRDGNSAIAIRHAEASAENPVEVNDTTVTQTEDGYTDWEGGVHRAQPAVEVSDRQGFTSRNVYIDGLVVQQGIDNKLVAPALWIPSPGVTGGINNGSCEEYTGPSCPWQIAPPEDLFYRTNLSPPEVCAP